MVFLLLSIFDHLSSFGITFHLMKILFILNGAKPSARKFQSAIKRNMSDGNEFHFVFTTKKGSAIDLAENAAQTFDVIAPVGGDGTLSECVHGLMKAQKTQSNTPLLIPIPLGSGNDFARNFNWKNDEANWRMRLASKAPIPVDVGRIQYANGEETYFQNVTSAGFGPTVVNLVEKFPSGWPGNLKFGLSILIAFIRYKKQTIHVRGEDFTWSGKAMAVVIANGKYFGSGIGIAPKANVNDGFFNVTIIGNITIVDYLMQLRKLKKCKLIQHPEVHYHRSKHIELKCESSLEVDGESGKKGNCIITVFPSALRFK